MKLPARPKLEIPADTLYPSQDAKAHRCSTRCPDERGVQDASCGRRRIISVCRATRAFCPKQSGFAPSIKRKQDKPHLNTSTSEPKFDPRRHTAPSAATPKPPRAPADRCASTAREIHPPFRLVENCTLSAVKFRYCAHLLDQTFIDLCSLPRSVLYGVHDRGGKKRRTP